VGHRTDLDVVTKIKILSLPLPGTAPRSWDDNIQTNHRKIGCGTVSLRGGRSSSSNLYPSPNIGEGKRYSCPCAPPSTTP